MCAKPLLMNFALLYFGFLFTHFGFSKVIMTIVIHDQLRMTHPNDPPVLFIP